MIASSKCSTSGCKLVAQIYCNCSESRFCSLCIITHLQERFETCHMVQSSNLPTPIFENVINPIEVLIKRLNLDSNDSYLLRNSKIKIRQLLRFTMAQLYSFADALGITESGKYHIWDEIYYIRIATGITYIKDSLRAPDNFLKSIKEIDIKIPYKEESHMKTEVKEELAPVKTKNDEAFEDLFREADL